MRTARALFSCAILAAVPALADSVLIEGGTVHTLAGPEPLHEASILIRDGRIERVGHGIAAPAGARVIAAHGKVITPGLMSPGTQLGLIEVDSLADTSDQSVSSGPLGAAFDIQYALNPSSTSIAQARADGLTRAVTMPGASAGAPFAGSGAILTLTESGEMIVRAQAAMFATIGGMAAAENGGSRSAQWIVLRNALEEARSYRRPRRPGGPRDQLLNRLDIEALQPVVEGRMPLAISTQRESDIRQAVRLATDHGVRVIIYGGAEAWRAAQLLAEHDVPVVLDPFANLPWTFDQIGARADNAALLASAGVTIAFAVPGIHMSHNAGSIVREAAGVAVANGLPWNDAMNALTVNPARIFGLTGSYGTLEPGRRADLVIWDGDPLEPSSAAETVFVDGAPVSLETRQKALAKRYAPRRHDEPWPPAYR